MSIDYNYKDVTITGYFQNFRTSHRYSVDGLFDVSVITVEEIPTISRIDSLSYILGSSKISHRKFPILTRWISNNVFYKGTYEVINHWTPDKDSDVSQFEQNLSSDSDLLNIEKHTLGKYTTHNFDWDNRIYTKFVNLNLRPKNIWIDQNHNWTFDGTPTTISSSDTNLEGVCIVAHEAFGWKTKSVDLNNGSITYTRPNVKNVYMFTYLNPLQVNGITLEPYKYFKVESDSLEISCENEATVIIKESVV